MKNRAKPESGFGPNDSNYNDMFLLNTGAGGDAISFGEVITRPGSADGTGGAVRTVDSDTGTSYTDEALTSGTKYQIRFVGTDAVNVEVGDFCFIKSYTLDPDGTTPYTRFYCAVVKTMFQGLGSLGG